MTARRRYLNRLVSSALVFVLLGGVSVAWGQLDTIGSVLPVVGIGAGQVLRVAVAGLRPDPRLEGGQHCRATLSFLDARTRLPFGPVKLVDLTLGEVDVVDLDTRSLGLRLRERIEILPVLTRDADGSGPCQVSYVVLGVLGRALSKIDAFKIEEKSGVDCPGQPLPWPILMSLGIGQTLQYTVVRETDPFDASGNPAPCDITANIRQKGTPSSPVVASLVTGPLAPGQMASVSVTETGLLTEDVLSSFVPITLPGGQTCPIDTYTGCIRTVQVIETLTAWTTVLSIAAPSFITAP